MKEPLQNKLVSVAETFASRDVDVVSAAQAYAGAGFAIFPVHGIMEGGHCTCGNSECKSIGKHPTLGGGFKSATSDARAVDQWLSSEKLTDAHNLGLPTGSSNGIWVLDIDGQEGRDTLARFEALHGPLPATLISTTGRGQHLVFRHPGRTTIVPTKTAVLGSGVDVRGDGGYIVAPPSRHRTGSRYGFVDPAVPVADAPGWLIEIVLKSSRRNPAEHSKLSTSSASKAVTSSTERRRNPEWLDLTLDEVSEALKHIDPDCDYSKWIDVGMALHSGGFSIEVWNRWSAKGEKFEAGQCEAKWAGFSESGGISIGTLIRYARDGGWDHEPQRTKLPINNLPPAFPKVSGTIDEAHESVRGALKAFWRVADDYARQERLRVAGEKLKVGGVSTEVPLPNFGSYHVIKGALGSGKSHAVRAEAIDYLSRNRDATGVIALPAHKLLEEYERAFAESDKLGVRVAAYRGIERADPDQPGKTMCWRSDTARHWCASGGKLESLCNGCSNNGSCGTSRQKQVEADLWLVTANMLFGPMPRMIRKDRLAWVVVDEDPHQFAIVGGSAGGTDESGKESLHFLTLAEATAQRDIPEGQENTADDELAWRDFRRATETLESGISGGRLSATELLEAGLTEGMAANAARIVHRLFLYPEGDGSRDDAAVLKAAGAVENENANTRKLIGLWTAIKLALIEELEHVPGIRVVVNSMKSGRVPVFDLMYRRMIDPAWKAPTILLDATATEAIMEAAFEQPTSTWITAEAAHPPSVLVRQIADKSFAKSMLFPDASAGNGAVRAGCNNVKKVLWYIEARSARYQGKGAKLDDGSRPDILVVGQKELVARLRAVGLPPNVETAHFGNVAGLDRWRGVRCIIVIGRRMVPPSDVERRSEVLNVADVEAVNQWYPRQTLGLHIKGKSEGAPVEVERHPDGLAEEIRFRACEGEIIQAIGRARALRRDDESPLQIDILGRSPLPGIEVDELLSWREAIPSIAEQLWSRWRIEIETRATHGRANLIANLLPDRYANAQAVRDAESRGAENSLSQSSIITLIDESHSERRVCGQLRLPGARYAVPIRQYDGGETLPAVILNTREECRGTTILTGDFWLEVDRAESRIFSWIRAGLPNLGKESRTILGGMKH